MDRKVDGDASEAALLKFADISLGEIMSINSSNDNTKKLDHFRNNKCKMV
jgi:hypothetical protein